MRAHFSYKGGGQGLSGVRIVQGRVGKGIRGQTDLSLFGLGG
jgi:hypothetical protein